MKVQKFHEPAANRYNFDFDLCHYKKGWAQLDTREDAEWFGNWANPTKRMLVYFAEGDVEIITCETDEEFAVELKRKWASYTEMGYEPAIDAMCEASIIERFNALGLGELLH